MKKQNNKMFKSARVMALAGVMTAGMAMTSFGVSI